MTGRTSGRTFTIVTRLHCTRCGADSGLQGHAKREFRLLHHMLHGNERTFENLCKKYHGKKIDRIKKTAEKWRNDDANYKRKSEDGKNVG